MFHHVSDICSNLLVGDGSSGLRRARLQVYRSLDHKQVLDACQKAKIPDTDFPKPIADYSALFLNAYKSRCKADYDPTSDGDFNLPQALHKIGEAEEAIRRFESAELGHRRAFAVLVAVKRPKGDRA